MVQVLVAFIGMVGLVMVESMRRTRKEVKTVAYNTQSNGGGSPYDLLMDKNDEQLQVMSRVMARLDLMDARAGRVEGRQFSLESKVERIAQQLESK